MTRTVLETERTNLLCMVPEDVSIITQLFNMSHGDALKWINENIEHQKKHGYSLFNAFLKDSGKYIGYCGCKEIELKGQIENELSWDIYKKYKEDDIDIEIAFAVRNYLFKHFSIHSLISLVESTNSQDMNVAEAIDMENERTLQKGHDKWLIYVVNRKSPKFLASFGDGESPVRSASLNRNENLPRSMKDLKRPKPRPR